MSETDKVLVPDKRNSADSLENFAIRIEEMFRKGKDQGPEALKRQVCRLLASKDLKVSAIMTAKWVEWRYGKAKETHKFEGTVTHEHRTITERLTDEELAAVEALIESAESRGNKG